MDGEISRCLFDPRIDRSGKDAADGETLGRLWIICRYCHFEIELN
jgi:hypothetical protein